MTIGHRIWAFQIQPFGQQQQQQPQPVLPRHLYGMFFALNVKLCGQHGLHLLFPFPLGRPKGSRAAVSGPWPNLLGKATAIIPRFVASWLFKGQLVLLRLITSIIGSHLCLLLSVTPCTCRSQAVTVMGYGLVFNHIQLTGSPAVQSTLILFYVQNCLNCTVKVNQPRHYGQD